MRAFIVVAVLVMLGVALFVLAGCALTPHQQCLANVSRETHRDYGPGLLGQALVGAINGPKPDRAEMLAACPS